VTVFLRRGSKLASKTAIVGPTGAYSVSLKVSGTSYAFAQWDGNGRSAGSGTKATKITVSARKKSKKR
jgi:hypothetical protein